jgi:hypothetical protein
MVFLCPVAVTAFLLPLFGLDRRPSKTRGD